MPRFGKVLFFRLCIFLGLVSDEVVAYGCWCSRVTPLVAASSAEKSKTGHAPGVKQRCCKKD